MDLENELLARIRAARSLDKTSTPSDYQVRMGDNGSVLINLKTGRAQLIYDDDSCLHDLEELGLADLDNEDDSVDDLTLSRQYHEQAATLRAIAKADRYPPTQKALLMIAEQYDVIASKLADTKKRDA